LAKVGLAEQPGHLYQPGRRLLRQEGNELRAVCHATQLLQCFQYRHVGFTSPVVFDALPTPNPHVSPSPSLRYKRLNHRGLPQTRFASDQDHLTCTAPYLVETLM
jgi:hypothetical protein